MLRKILISLLLIACLGSAYLFYVVDQGLNKTVKKAIKTSIKVTKQTRIPATEKVTETTVVKTEEKSKPNVLQKISEKSNELMAEVSQKIMYNRESKKVEKIEKVEKEEKKETKKIIEKKTVENKKPQAYSEPLYAPDEIATDNMVIDSEDKFVHYGYEVEVSIEAVDLVAIANNVLKETYYTEVTSGVEVAETEPVIEKAIEEELFEVVLDEEKIVNDELTYRYSANKKDFKIIKPEKVVKKEAPKLLVVEASESINKNEAIEEPISDKELSKVPEQEIEKAVKTDAVPVKKEKTDDLVFYDYSAEGEYSTAPTEPVKAKESKPEYSNKIAPVLTTQSAPVEPAKTKPRKWTFNNDERVARATPPQDPATLASTVPNIPNISDETEKKDDYKGKESFSTSSSALEVEVLYVYGDKEDSSMAPFEIDFADSGERIDSAYEGFIKLDHSLNSESGVRRGRVASADFISTIVDFSIHKNETSQYLVPMLSRKFWYDFIDDNKIDEFKASILIKIDDQIVVSPENIEVTPFYFDSEFRLVEKRSQASYELYAGLESGNITLRFDDGEGEGFKDVTLQNSVIYYERSDAKLRDITLSLNERTILGTSSAPLDLPESKIVQMYLNEKSSKRGVNAYEFKDVLVPSGSRAYFQIYNKANIDVGIGSSLSRVEVPSLAFKEEVFEKLDVRNPESLCVIQINLPHDKELDLINLKGEGIISEGDESKIMHTEYHAFDSDGKFYSEFGKDSKKIFVIGEGTGYVNIHLGYLDDTQDHILSVCDSSYTVEGLNLR